MSSANFMPTYRVRKIAGVMLVLRVSRIEKSILGTAR